METWKNIGVNSTISIKEVQEIGILLTFHAIHKVEEFIIVIFPILSIHTWSYGFDYFRNFW